MSLRCDRCGYEMPMRGLETQEARAELAARARVSRVRAIQDLMKTRSYSLGDGKVLMNLGRRPEGFDSGHMEHAKQSEARTVDGWLGAPTDVTWDQDDNIYVSDGYVNSRIAKYDKEDKVRARNPEGAAALLRRLWYDVAQSAVPASLRALAEIADPARIVFGSDYPFSRFPEEDLEETVAGLADFPGFEATLKSRIAYDNAATLFPKLA